eukprot:COSAG01_NODE_3290_length_6307_cov_2.975519_9_plen_85_part_01
MAAAHPKVHANVTPYSVSVGMMPPGASSVGPAGSAGSTSTLVHPVGPAGSAAVAGQFDMGKSQSKWTACKMETPSTYVASHDQLH